jgi:hypothetical protein
VTGVSRKPISFQKLGCRVRASQSSG